MRSAAGVMDSLNQRKLISTYASAKHISVTEWIEDSPGGKRHFPKANIEAIKAIKAGSMLILSDISVLGPSFTIVSDALQRLLHKNIRTYAIKEDILLDGKKTPQLKACLLLCQKVEKSLISQRVANGRIKREANGKSVGRPKGKKSVKIKLTGRENEIREYRKRGFSLSTIGNLVKANRATVKTFMTLNKIK
ncbi:MAG: recombinase family protein [Cyclobacteriaceae bacterium]|nr:MAG: recombinase family protein [Cyclobacteriaceae bacterium]